MSRTPAAVASSGTVLPLRGLLGRGAVLGLLLAEERPPEDPLLLLEEEAPQVPALEQRPALGLEDRLAGQPGDPLGELDRPRHHVPRDDLAHDSQALSFGGTHDAA